MTWTVREHDTYATLHRDGSDVPIARVHVIAEAHEMCRALNIARVIAAPHDVTHAAREATNG